MKAAVVVGVNDIRVQDILDPVCAAGMVKVAVAFCGICGSDVPRVLKGACHSFPQVLGHEFSGRVVEVGDGVSTVSVGDHVVGVPLIPCFKCEDCLLGNYSLCKHYSFVGSRQQGAMAEYVVLPAENVIRVDKSLPLDFAALTEPSTVALHGILKNGFNPKPEDKVAIIGAGTIALLVLQWCRILGARDVVVFGRSKGRLPVAMQYGAQKTFSTLDDDCVKTALHYSQGHGYRYVFDVVGSDSTVRDSLELVANKGSICLIGTPTRPMSFAIKEWELINRKELMLSGSWMSYSSPWPGDEWQQTARYAASGELCLGGDLIFRHFPIEKVREAFDLIGLNASTVKGRILLDL